MTNYTYVIFMFFIFVLGKNIYTINAKTVDNSNNGVITDYLAVNESKKTNLPIEPAGNAGGLGIHSYRFLFTSFEKKLFAFQRENEKNGDNSNMVLWTSSDNGITWTAETKIACNLDTTKGACNIMSSMVIENELVVIYGNDDQYAITKSKDGSKWENETPKSRDTMKERELLYYSGNPSESFVNEDEKNLYVMCYITDEISDQVTDDKDYKTVGACSESTDKGSTWKVNYYIRVKNDVEEIADFDQIFVLNKQFHFMATIGNTKNRYLVCSQSDGYETVFHCQTIEEAVGQQDTYPLMGLNTDNKSLGIILNPPTEYVMAITNSDVTVKSTLLTIKSPTRKVAGEVENTENIMFYILYITESEYSVLYEYKNEIYHIGTELRKKRQGCQFISEKQKDSKPIIGHEGDYTQTVIYKDINSESDIICSLDNFEPESGETDVRFFVKVPEAVDFETSDNCFKQSYVDSDDDSPLHARTIIKVKDVVELDVDKENKMKEIEFIYPADLHSLMKYNKTIFCIPQKLKFVVNYKFTKDINIVKDVSFPTIKNDFSVEKNRLDLQDYNWNVSIPETPTGSYLLDSFEYMRRFQVYVDVMNNTPNAKKDYEEFIKDYPMELPQTISEPIDGTEDYEGIDLTNSSKHYKKKEFNIQSPVELDVKVVVPKEGATVGFICPLEKSSVLAELNCFDIVIDMNGVKVKFEEVFQDVPFFMTPKTMLYDKKFMAVESLLYFNGESYTALENKPKAIHFQCSCTVNTYAVTLNYSIGTSSSDFTKPDPPKPDDPDDEDDKKPGGSTRSILSSAIVLLVLFHVFSSSSFFN